MDREVQRAYMSGTVCPLFLSSSFTLTIVSTFVSLICQCSMSDLSAACWSVPLSALPYPPFVPDVIHHEPYHDTFSFSLTMSTLCPLPPPCGRVGQQQQAETDGVFIYGCPKLTCYFLTVALCLCVCCHAPCYAKVNVRMLMSCRHVIRGFSLCCINPWVFLYCSKIIDGSHCWCMDVT